MKYIKYGYVTYEGYNDFYVDGIRKKRHNYPASPRHGVRTVWKEFDSTPLGKFDTRVEAQLVGRVWVQTQKEPRLGVHFAVVVGNIGTVYDGPLFKEALQCYSEYKRQSKENYGRAAGEPVTLFRDGEPKYEYQGTLSPE